MVPTYTTRTHVAIQGVCAWPNLVQLPDQTLVVTIFNQPTHGGWEGDLDCWVSVDGGEQWTFRGRPAPHDPGANRMHCAAGLTRGGDMVVLSSGWDHRPGPGTYRHPREGKVTGVWVSRSGDAAKTWRQDKAAVQQPPGPEHTLIPFGMVVHNQDGTLAASLYGWENSDPEQRISFLYVSHDDGESWEYRSVIGQRRSETNLLALPDGTLLATARTHGPMYLELYISHDAGKTWQPGGPLSLPNQIPGQMLRLADGRIVLCYGNRCQRNYGIDFRISSDQGRTWGPPMRLADRPLSDGGYPSSIQRPDGRIVTAYYNQLTGSFHYEMCIANWDVNDFEKPGC